VPHASDASDIPHFYSTFIGGVYQGESLFYASLCEYLLEYNAPHFIDGFGGGWSGVTFHDYVLQGTVYTWGEDQLSPTFHPTGTSYTAAFPVQFDALGNQIPVPTAFGCVDGGCLALERAQYDNYAAALSEANFAFAGVATTLDFYTSYRSLCGNIITILANALSSFIAQTQPIFLLPSAEWACAIQNSPGGICALAAGQEALFGLTYCGYNIVTDVVDVSGLIIPTSTGQVKASSYLTLLGTACATPCPIPSPTKK